MDYKGIALEILESCVRGNRAAGSRFHLLVDHAASSDAQVAKAASAALFGILAEGLSDRFEPRLAEDYAALFSEVVERIHPELKAETLKARYRRASQVNPFRPGRREPQRVCVLSRITLGADIAITSVLLQAAKRRFPEARLVFVGPEKNWRLFARDPELEWIPANYERGGTLREKLEAGRTLEPHLNRTDTLVIDPDSRLTQLGLLPVCAEENYLFFNSRTYGADTDHPLSVLASRWAEEVLEIPGCQPYAAPAAETSSPTRPFIAVNLGVGGNPAKKLPEAAERSLLEGLGEPGLPIILDLGAGSEEEARARALARSLEKGRAEVHLWKGEFAELVRLIGESALYVGYDSAGQHAAAALGTPLVTIFAGFACERAFHRWRPCGPGPKAVIRADGKPPEAVVNEALSAAGGLIRGPVA